MLFGHAHTHLWKPHDGFLLTLCSFEFCSCFFRTICFAAAFFGG